MRPKTANKNVASFKNVGHYSQLVVYFLQFFLILLIKTLEMKRKKGEGEKENASVHL